MFQEEMALVPASLTFVSLSPRKYIAFSLEIAVVTHLIDQL
jgi:hypothetical protein